MTEQEELLSALTVLSLTLAFHPKSIFHIRGAADRICSRLSFTKNREIFDQLRSSFSSIRMFKNIIKETGNFLLLETVTNFG